MPSMTKSKLIEQLAERQGITKSRAELVVNTIFESMATALEHGDHIEIRGFGSLTIRKYRPYTGRNPRTNKPVSVNAKKLPFFKVGKELKELVNDSLARGVSIEIDTGLDDEVDGVDAMTDDDDDELDVMYEE